jgi:hypothetical protein
MAEAAGCHVLAVMGSGETSPTMVTVHRELVARLGLERPRAVVLETPYWFQVNADDLSARTKRDYFAKSVGLDVTVLAGLRQPHLANPADPPDPADPAGPTGPASPADPAGPTGSASPTDPATRGDSTTRSRPDTLAMGSGDGSAGVVRDADWVFSGPGSPTFALSQWKDAPVAAALRDRLLAGRGVTVLASAAAVTIGLKAVPVYEIYKVGTPPHWVDGLDLMSALGLKVAVIPHYDNAEGRNYDTRFCYLGERRLRQLEQELPDDAAVLGIDEHTVVIFDLQGATVEVSGRGGLTVRRHGASTILPAGTTLELAELQDLVTRGQPSQPKPPAARQQPTSDQAAEAPRALTDIADGARRRFDVAERDRDATAMVAAILDLDTAIHDWAADTEEDQGTEQARAVLRTLVTRLGRAAQEGLCDPRERLAPAVERLIALRAALRDDGSYQPADAIRDALAAAGLQLKDGTDGTHWELG